MRCNLDTPTRYRYAPPATPWFGRTRGQSCDILAPDLELELHLLTVGLGDVEWRAPPRRGSGFMRCSRRRPASVRRFPRASSAPSLLLLGHVEVGDRAFEG